MLRVWNLSLVIATFCLTILGTFLTRSGVIDSVHAFTQSDIGPWLLTFLGVVAATGIGLIAWRGDQLRAPGRIDSAVSRESAFLMNNLLFAALAFVVLLGTVFPLIAEALRGSGSRWGSRTSTAWPRRSGSRCCSSWRRRPRCRGARRAARSCATGCSIPAWIGGLTMLAAVVLGARGLAEVLAYGLGAFATAGIVRQFVLGIRGRRRALGESRAVALGRATRSNPRLYGGLVVHFGVVLIAVVLAASSAYGANRDVKLKQGESATVVGLHASRTSARTPTVSEQKTTNAADIKVQKGDRELGTYAPAISTYPNSTEGIGTPSVHTGLVDDVYLTLVSSPNAQREITLGVRINTLIIWLWIGGAFMALGTILALAPRLRRRPSRIPSDDLAPAPSARRTTARSPTSARSRRRRCRCEAPRSHRRARGGAGRRRVRRGARAQRRAATRRRTRSRATWSGKAAPTFDLPNARRRSRDPRRHRGQVGHRQLLELVVHPVPAGAAGAQGVLRGAQATTPTSRWSASCATRTRPATSKAYVKQQRRRVDGRARSRSIAALDFGTRGQPETYAISPSGDRRGGKFGAMQPGELELFLNAARQAA